MNTSVNNARPINYLPIIGLALVFLIPFICAKFLVTSQDILQYLGNTSKGKWLSEDITVKNYHSKWLLIILKDKINQKKIHTLNNLHIALGKYQNELAVVSIPNSLSTINSIEQGYQSLIKYSDQQSSNTQLDSAIFVADPTGRVLISYSQSHIGKPLLKDLKKFIKLTSSS